MVNTAEKAKCKQLEKRYGRQRGPNIGTIGDLEEISLVMNE